MKLDITSLLSGKVRVLPFEFDIPSDGENAPLPPVGVTVTSPVRVRGKISDSGTCLHLSLGAEADYTALCDRCGGETGGVVSCRLERMVAEEGVITREDSDDYFIACEGALDLDEDIVEELMLSFPSRILCREDCKGACPVCGQNKNEAECGCAAREANAIDPRWQVLARLLEEQKKEE